MTTLDPQDVAANWSPPWTHVNIRDVTCGPVHALPGDPRKVATMHAWLLANPTLDLPPLELRPKPNGTVRIHDGRHRFLAYVLAARETVPGIVRPPPATIKREYDAAHTLSYGYYTCACGADFYGGGPAMHARGCEHAGTYNGCTYHYGPNEGKPAAPDDAR